MRRLTGDMSRGDLRPYFFWDEDVSIDELREVLEKGDSWNRDRLLGKLLREARDSDVWYFITPEMVAEALPRLGRRIGRRRRFWDFIINGWKEDGLLQ
jgi:hypothetical protein